MLLDYASLFVQQGGRVEAKRSPHAGVFKRDLFRLDVYHSGVGIYFIANRDGVGASGRSTLHNRLFGGSLVGR